MRSLPTGVWTPITCCRPCAPICSCALVESHEARAELARAASLTRNEQERTLLQTRLARPAAGRRRSTTELGPILAFVKVGLYYSQSRLYREGEISDASVETAGLPPAVDRRGHLWTRRPVRVHRPAVAGPRNDRQRPRAWVGAGSHGHPQGRADGHRRRLRRSAFTAARDDAVQRRALRRGVRARRRGRRRCRTVLDAVSLRARLWHRRRFLLSGTDLDRARARARRAPGPGQRDRPGHSAAERLCRSGRGRRDDRHSGIDRRPAISGGHRHSPCFSTRSAS